MERAAWKTGGKFCFRDDDLVVPALVYDVPEETGLEALGRFIGFPEGGDGRVYGEDGAAGQAVVFEVFQKGQKEKGIVEGEGTVADVFFGLIPYDGIHGEEINVGTVPVFRIACRGGLREHLAECGKSPLFPLRGRIPFSLCIWKEGLPFFLLPPFHFLEKVLFFLDNAEKFLIEIDLV